MSASQSSNVDAQQPTLADPPSHHALDEYRRRHAKYQANANALEARANRLSLCNVGSVLVALVCGIAAYTQSSVVLAVIAGLAIAAFAACFGYHVRTTALRDRANIRARICLDEVARQDGSWLSMVGVISRDEPYAATHPYAFDIDVAGAGGLLDWIDHTRTSRGHGLLAAWLGDVASLDVIRARQAAVRDLSTRVDFRIELEAEGRLRDEDHRLDLEPFVDFVNKPNLFARMPWIGALIHVLPVATVGLLLFSIGGSISYKVGVGLLVTQILIFFAANRSVSARILLASQRRGFAESVIGMLRRIENEKFEAAHLRSIQEKARVGGKKPSELLRVLDRWLGLADLREQFPLHLFANVFLLWDLHCLFRLERWKSNVADHVPIWFDAIAEVEALSSLAAVAFADPHANFPVVEDAGPLHAKSIAHPLLVSNVRVVNDVDLDGRSHALIVTGSNMAGKSTLLRAVGLNVALALAGGPVIAASMQVPRVRLRASMRANDSLQKGASYFHAELQKLHIVVEDLDAKPPVFFLLDELLRGTNERARHVGAKSIVLHLLHHGASGLVATHDVALAKLESELAEQNTGRATNVHFTDVIREGEMIFDYKLRAGVVQTSNALRLLEAAGIPVVQA